MRFPLLFHPRINTQKAPTIATYLPNLPTYLLSSTQPTIIRLLFLARRRPFSLEIEIPDKRPANTLLHALLLPIIDGFGIEIHVPHHRLIMRNTHEDVVVGVKLL